MAGGCNFQNVAYSSATVFVLMHSCQLRCPSHEVSNWSVGTLGSMHCIITPSFVSAHLLQQCGPPRHCAAAVVGLASLHGETPQPAPGSCSTQLVQLPILAAYGLSFPLPGPATNNKQVNHACSRLLYASPAYLKNVFSDIVKHAINVTNVVKNPKSALSEVLWY